MLNCKAARDICAHQCTGREVRDDAVVQLQQQPTDRRHTADGPPWCRAHSPPQPPPARGTARHCSEKVCLTIRGQFLFPFFLSLFCKSGQKATERHPFLFVLEVDLVSCCSHDWHHDEKLLQEERVAACYRSSLGVSFSTHSICRPPIQAIIAPHMERTTRDWLGCRAPGPRR